MSESSTGSRAAVDLALLFARVPLGAFFLIAGLGKVQGGVGNFVRSASGMVPTYLPTAIGRGYLYAVPWAEIVVGVCLILGLFTRFTGLIVSLMLISFTIAATGLRAAGGGPFHTNVVFLGIALCIMLLGPGRMSVDAFMPRRRKK